MTLFKIIILAISAGLLSLLISCTQETGRSTDIGQIRLNPEIVIMTDSAGVTLSHDSEGINESFTIDTLGEGVYHLKVTILTERPMNIRNLEIPLQFMTDSAVIWDEIKNAFHWVPNLKKNPGDIIAQHVFRSPAIILTHMQSAVSIIPDLEAIKTFHETPYYLDLNFEDNGIFVKYGLSNYKVRQHVYYEQTDSSFILPEKIELGLYLICSDHSSPLDILKNTNELLWNTFGSTYLDSLSPQVLTFRQYADAGYSMALSKYWVDGPKPGTGGITLSTFQDRKTGVFRGREFKDDLWFHSWFNNARTAYGLYQWGVETYNKEWMEKAISTMNLLLSSPQNDGFFPTIWVPEKNGWVSSGQGGGPELYHVPDNAWTALWLLRFNDELKKLKGADDFLVNLALGLMKTQQENGSFPARVSVSELRPDSVLMNSASGSMATWFLEEMILRNKLSAKAEEQARASVKRSLSFLEKEILPAIRFQDYEVFFSCAPNSLNHFDSLTWLYPHNTLSMQWSSEAFLKAYQLFNRKEDIENAEYCLNLLSLYQQVWSPPFIDFYAFGGFGAQNTDAEWSDARQAQFAETYLNFYMETRNIQYLQRGIAATRASFALMAIPENKAVSPLNYEGSPYNGEFIGAMAENFGHSGSNERSGQSGFHWGTGSALTTAALFRKKLGDIYLDSHSKTATGIDGIVIEKTEWNDTIRLVTRQLKDLKRLKIYSDLKDLIGSKVLLDNKPRAITVSFSRR